MTYLPSRVSLARVNLLTAAVLVSLGGFVVFLIVSNYQASKELERALAARLASTASRHAVDVQRSLNERLREVTEMAAAAEMGAYFKTLDFGPGVSFSLRVALSSVTNRFQWFHTNRVMGKELAYARLALVDDSENVVVEVPPSEHPPGSGLSDELTRAIRSTQPLSLGDHLLISAPCVYGDGEKRIGGQVVAWLNPVTVTNLFRPAEVSVDTLVGLEDEEGRWLAPGCRQELAALAELSSRSADIGDAGTNLTVKVGGQTRGYLVSRFKLEALPLSLVVAYRTSPSSGLMSATRLWVTLSIISFVILGGGALIVFLNTRWLLLKVRLDGSVLRQKEVEEKNRVLETEMQERMRVQAALCKSEQNYREIFNATTDAILIQDFETGCIREVNRAAMELLGCRPEGYAGGLAELLADAEPPYTAEHALGYLWQARLEGPQLFEWRLKRPDLGTFWVEVALRSSDIGGHGRILAVVRNITDRKSAEQDRLALREQLSQAQKMESVGCLAGGVAHDFNNLLTAILGNLELVLTDLPPERTDLRDALLEVEKASRRAGELTRQLLAFSRKQVLQIKILALNELVIGFGKMLKRLIGEDIEVATVLNPVIARVKADPSQLEQVILNLAVNARDAMPRGGRLRIETSVYEATGDGVGVHPELDPGEYVVLSVSDTGCGMAPEVQRRAFEPFFTTKGVGKGTGLGLATVYGIIKQHGGHVSLQSQLGVGTTVRVFLPRVYEKETPATGIGRSRPLRGTETILVVEDEPAVRLLTCRMLSGQGYQVIEARDGREAVRLAREWDHIDLLLTDVIMPQMSGKEVFEKISDVRPGIRVLFTSGYSDEVVGHHGILNEEIHFLHKPFTAQSLTQKIRTALREKC
ncbi:MAG: hybrid sensor histidine kinase/response regulator [Limisphaerales bacterium]